MNGSIVFDPIAPVWLILLLLLAGVASALLAFARGARGWPLRLLAAALLALLLADPQRRREERAPLPDVAVIVEDESASQTLDGRNDAAAAAIAALKTRLSALGDTEVVETKVAGEDETRLVDAVGSALSAAPRGRLGAVFVVTDGQTVDGADVGRLSVDAPVHLLLTGRPDETDRKITLVNAPRYGVVKEKAKISFRVDDLGPDEKLLAGGSAEVSLRVDGAEAARRRVPVGEEISFEAPLDRPGRLVVELTASPRSGELTTRNNTAVLDIAAIRDRLRVLLISGAPHPGERVWRNLLKSDPSVDLVHFTILRPIDKSDPFEQQDELALIPFPQDELFNEKLGAFDLVIFDRYDFPGVLDFMNFVNIAQYVRDGGAVLVAAGQEFEGVSVLGGPGNFGAILPATPLGGTIETPFRPRISPDGARHPVTSGLKDADIWGRWLRAIPATPRSGRTLMTGPGGAPLLILDRVGAGRVGLLLSDHVWLWARGFDGGGPHAELLRRIAHWLMKEPELEEEQLRLSARGSDLEIERRSLGAAAGPVDLELPDGRSERLSLVEVEPGRFEARIPSAPRGLYRARDGDLFAVGAMGIAAAPEFQSVVSDRRKLAPLVEKTRGGVFQLRRNGGVEAPTIRRVGMNGGPRAGAGWAGVVHRRAFRTDAVSQQPLAPVSVWLAATLAALVGAWAVEGRRRFRKPKIYESS